MNPNDHIIENIKKSCDIILDNFLSGEISAEERDKKLKKLSENLNKLEADKYYEKNF